MLARDTNAIVMFALLGVAACFWARPRWRSRWGLAAPVALPVVAGFVL